MEKILIKLIVPAVMESFDIFVPQELDIAMLTSLISKGVEDLCRERYVSSQEEKLCLKDPDTLLHPERTLMEYGIKDGSVLVLM